MKFTWSNVNPSQLWELGNDLAPSEWVGYVGQCHGEWFAIHLKQHIEVPFKSEQEARDWLVTIARMRS